jgi:hypothetical protein
MDANQRVARAPHVGATRQGGESVLLDVVHGKYHTLNEVGTRIWELLATPTTVAAIVRRVCTEYDIDGPEADRVASDVSALIRQLRKSGLLQSGESHTSGGASTANARRPVQARRTLEVPSTFMSGMLIVLVRCALKTAGYVWTARWIMDRVERVPVTDGHDDATVAAVEYRIAMGAAFFPGRAACLERSLALYCYLRSRGVAVEYRLGARLYPFAAHAWIEYRGVPINDVPEHVTHFYPIGVGAS